MEQGESRKGREMRTIEVEIALIGRSTGKVVFNEGTTLREALRLQGINPEGYSVRVNNRAMSLDDMLQDRDRVLCSPNVRGGSVL